MDDKLIAVLVGVVAGAAGYWFTTFWMKPILQYRELKSKILADLIFYAQVTNADGLNEQMQKLYERRVESNRRHSADLSACILELPNWYKRWLRIRGYAPERAATHLIGFSNTNEHPEANRRIEGIKSALGIKSEMI
ncbi:MAG: hypothetical protein HY799_01720 [Nitrosomonadales bacterium]|nr:hypothetical protein [Nitrosomonadales bacterium]